MRDASVRRIKTALKPAQIRGFAHSVSKPMYVSTANEKILPTSRNYISRVVNKMF